jgi:beta-lactamase superfamily II metal-dependent hydrolase
LTKSYVNRKTSYFYKFPDKGDRYFVLLYGDEIETLNQTQNNRMKIIHRKREGWIDQDHYGDKAVLEIYFIDVGQGDSTFIVTPGRKKILIDGGINNRALGFLAWKYRLSEAPPGEKLTIDLMVLTHADGDHIIGLTNILSDPRFKIKQIVHSGIATFAENKFDTVLGDLKEVDRKYLVTSHNKLDELTDSHLSTEFLKWKKAITALPETTYGSVSAGSEIDIQEPEIEIKVLFPKPETVPGIPTAAYRWFGESISINAHSVVLNIKYKNVSLLLSGDLNKEGAKYLMENQNLLQDSDAIILKAPHHGSHKYYRPWLEAVNPQISVISSGDSPDHGHPRANFIGTIGNVSRSNEPLVFSTELAGLFIDVGENIKEDLDLSDEEYEKLDQDSLLKLRRLFKRSLHGMINVRTNGIDLFAARRVKQGYCWESYGPIKPKPRS